MDWVLRVRTDMLFSSLPAHARPTFLAFRGPFRGASVSAPQNSQWHLPRLVLASQLGMRQVSRHQANLATLLIAPYTLYIYIYISILCSIMTFCKP